VHPQHTPDKRQRSGAGEERERSSSAPAAGHERLSPAGRTQGIKHSFPTRKLLMTV